NVHRSLAASGLQPIIEGRHLPPFWARRLGDDLALFFAHPAAHEVRYPMTCGQAHAPGPVDRDVTIRHRAHRHRVRLRFAPGESLLLIAGVDGTLRAVDLGYIPPPPVPPP